jgi:hypothetical protein
MRQALLITIACATLFITGRTYAQNFKTGFDTNPEQASWTEYRLGDENEFYMWEYSTNSARSQAFCLVHNYPVGGTEETEDWFVSPGFDFSKGGKIDSIWHYFTGFGTPIPGDTIAIYVITGHQNPDSAASVTMIHNYTDTSYKIENAWKLDTNITIPVRQGTSYIGIRYTTTSNWLDVKFDDLSIIGYNATDISEVLVDRVTLYPNPASDILNLEIPDELDPISISIEDFSGRTIFSSSNEFAQLSIDNLVSGTYLIRLITGQGMLTKNFIKN